jgi:hypothetical protein
LKTEINGAWEFIALTTHYPLPSKIGTNFTGKWHSLSWYSSLAGQGHGVQSFSKFLKKIAKNILHKSDTQIQKVHGKGLPSKVGNHSAGQGILYFTGPNFLLYFYLLKALLC